MAPPIFGRDAEDVAWRPDPAEAAASRLARFLRSTGEPTLEALQARASADPGWFWGAAADDIAVAWQRRPREVLDLSGGPAWARWWIGGAFDWSWAAIEPRAARDPNAIAVTLGRRRRLDPARDELAARLVRPDGCWTSSENSASGQGTGSASSCRCLSRRSSQSLRCVELGAILTPIFSGYAAPAIASRLVDCEAKLLITADGFLRRGAWVDLKSVADAAVAAAPGVERVLVVRRAGPALDVPWHEDRDRWWRAYGRSARMLTRDVEPADTDPETPYMLIYTSGTTGRPKGAVHVHGGFPIKAAQDLAHTFDLTGRATRCSGSPTSAG